RVDGFHRGDRRPARSLLEDADPDLLGAVVVLCQPIVKATEIGKLTESVERDDDGRHGFIRPLRAARVETRRAWRRAFRSRAGSCPVPRSGRCAALRAWSMCAFPALPRSPAQ